MTWQFAAVHSHIDWAVKYLGISSVKGSFRKFEAVVDLESDDPTRWSIHATIDAASLDTGMERRDDALRGPDYLDAERFPTITFKSKTVLPRKNDQYQVIGEMTIHGVTREVAVEAWFNGEVVDSRGQLRRGFTLETTIKRRDFDVCVEPPKFSTPGVAGEEVRIAIEVQAIKQP